LEGTAFLLIGEKWIEATKGAFFIIPKNTMHDFANRSNNITGLLNFFIPGGFERNMPSIVKWFEENR
jgi:quercetin dioxygenase-like cupin family protein